MKAPAGPPELRVKPTDDFEVTGAGSAEAWKKAEWVPLKKRAGVRSLDLYSLRHTFASLGRTAGESAFNAGRMMGHSKSVLVDQVYAHSMQSGMASVAENLAARALGVKPQLRVIEGGQQDVRQPLDETSEGNQKNVVNR